MMRSNTYSDAVAEHESAGATLRADNTPANTREALSAQLRVHEAKLSDALERLRAAEARFAPLRDKLLQTRAKLAELRDNQANETRNAEALREKWKSDLRRSGKTTAAVKETMRDEHHATELANEYAAMAVEIERQEMADRAEALIVAHDVKATHATAIEAHVYREVAVMLSQAWPLAAALHATRGMDDEATDRVLGFVGHMLKMMRDAHADIEGLIPPEIGSTADVAPFGGAEVSSMVSALKLRKESAEQTP